MKSTVFKIDPQAEIEAMKEENLKLRTSLIECQHANEAKTQFLAVLSHEIRTPLSAILGFADLLSEVDPGLSRYDLARKIQNNGSQLLSLIDDVLNLSKFEAGNIPVRKEAFSAVEVIEDVLSTLMSSAKVKKLRLRTHYELGEAPARSFVIYSDRVRFRQIVSNLLNNAIKFSREGEIHVHLTHAQGFQLEVEDCGIGISERAKDRLFKPFSQGDHTIDAQFGGFGIGLALSRKLAHALGGDVILKSSSPGCGSCFQLTLDPGRPSERILGRARIEENDPKPKRGPKLGDVKILLVDDSNDNQELMKFYLLREGAKVELACDGFEAVSKAQNQPFDVVLMDVQMPGMDGLQATRTLRSGGFKTPIIALTAHALDDEVSNSLNAGCNAHLSKPISRKELVDRIYSAVH